MYDFFSIKLSKWVTIKQIRDLIPDENLQKKLDDISPNLLTNHIDKPTFLSENNGLGKPDMLIFSSSAICIMYNAFNKF